MAKERMDLYVSVDKLLEEQDGKRCPRGSASCRSVASRGRRAERGGHPQTAPASAPTI
jgi:hypothetical protein